MCIGEEGVIKLKSPKLKYTAKENVVKVDDKDKEQSKDKDDVKSKDTKDDKDKTESSKDGNDIDSTPSTADEFNMLILVGLIASGVAVSSVKPKSVRFLYNLIEPISLAVGLLPL